MDLKIKQSTAVINSKGIVCMLQYSWNVTNQLLTLIQS